MAETLHGMYLIYIQSINTVVIECLFLYCSYCIRKKKLLQKQAKGKKRMKAIGKVNVPQEAFLAVIRMNDDNDDGYD